MDGWREDGSKGAGEREKKVISDDGRKMGGSDVMGPFLERTVAPPTQEFDRLQPKPRPNARDAHLRR